LNYGSAGPQSTQRLVLEHLITKFGLKMVHVPYKGGAGPATTALLGGEVSALIVTVASFIPHVKSGRVRILAVTSAKRSPALPDVPTMSELGIPELRYGAWQSLHVPAKTPAPVVNKLQAVMARVLKDPWVIERFAAGGAEPLHHESPAAFEKFLKEQQAFWIGIVKRANITIE
jgi:tripartite-type tricarboxylate transporter receptor subunit TctC